MAQPRSAAPAFDDLAPWGTYIPSRGVAVLLGLAHRTPRWLAPLVKLFRRPVKYHVNVPLDLTIWGLRLRLLPRGNMSEQKLISAPQFFDPEELGLLAARLGPGGTFVDIGANAGVYSFWAHRCMQGQGRIVSVEPDPEMRRRLEFNCRTNSLGDIEVCPVALSDHAGSAVLQIDPRQRGQNTLESGEAKRAGGTRTMLEVPVDTLLHLLQSRGIERVDALKIDIEGHEPPVLRHFLANAPASLRPGILITEFKAETAASLEQLLRDTGYRRRETTRLNFIYEQT